MVGRPPHCSQRMLRRDKDPLVLVLGGVTVPQLKGRTSGTSTQSRIDGVSLLAGAGWSPGRCPLWRR